MEQSSMSGVKHIQTERSMLRQGQIHTWRRFQTLACPDRLTARRDNTKIASQTEACPGRAVPRTGQSCVEREGERERGREGEREVRDLGDAGSLLGEVRLVVLGERHSLPLAAHHRPRVPCFPPHARAHTWSACTFARLHARTDRT
eukprot:2719542-Rhodomonas_salina.1